MLVVGEVGDGDVVEHIPQARPHGEAAQLAHRTGHPAERCRVLRPGVRDRRTGPRTEPQVGANTCEPAQATRKRSAYICEWARQDPNLRPRDYEQQVGADGRCQEPVWRLRSGRLIWVGKRSGPQRGRSGLAAVGRPQVLAQAVRQEPESKIRSVHAFTLVK